MTQRRASIAIVSSLALVWLSPQSARAYDPKAHSRIVEVAALAMQDDAAQPSVPSGASTQEFADYLTLVRAAPAALGQLGTGLPTKVLGTNANHISGMHYTTAGPQRRPGAIDVALIAATDISGLSLNAYASDGDDIYGDEDDVNRLGPAPWQAYSIGHIEFSSLDNLAAYGWKKWVNSGRKTAEGLAWPLHAIGDGAAPHHVVGTTSWGHRALEPGVDNALDIFFPAAGAEREAQHGRVLSASYAWWTLLHSTVDAAHPHGNLETYIEQVALATRTQILSNGEWAYKDGTSLQALVDDKDGERAYVEDERANVQTLLDLSSAATLAFLTFASERAADRGDGNAKCPPGTAFHIFEGCLSNSADPTQWPNNGCNQWEAYCNTAADCRTVELTCENHCCRTLLQ